MRFLIFLFIGLSIGFILISTQNDPTSIYKHYFFRRSVCKKSLPRAAAALLEEERLHKSCLTAAQKKAYKAGSHLRTQLKQYPPELQRVFLEVLNRRLNGDRSYKTKIHPLYNLRPVIRKYFITPKNLQNWWQEREDVLHFLAQVKIKTPEQQKIHYLSLNKFYKSQHPQAYQSKAFKVELAKLYDLLARIHHDGTNTALHNLKTIRHHAKAYSPEEIEYLEKCIRRIEDNIKTLYEACYYPPSANNYASLPVAIDRLSQDSKTLKSLQKLQKHLHTLEGNANKATSVSQQHFAGVDLLIDILITLKALQKQALS